MSPRSGSMRVRSRARGQGLEDVVVGGAHPHPQRQPEGTAMGEGSRVRGVVAQTTSASRSSFASVEGAKNRTVDQMRDDDGDGGALAVVQGQEAGWLELLGRRWATLLTRHPWMHPWQ